MFLAVPAFLPAAEQPEQTDATKAAVESVAGQTSHAAHAEHGIPQKAQALGHQEGFVTNSMLVTWVVALALILFARFATRNMQDIPSGAQNFWEWLVEGLYDFLEGIIGHDLVKKTFWFFATIFILILFTNWSGLVPGFGTVGWGVQGEHGFEVTRPLLRGGNADLNMTAAMAMTFFFFWTVWALQANGVKGFFLHLFGPKGESTGALKLLLTFIFLLVGFLEVISILFRPISLSFRLYGNIFAGENMLDAMANLINEPAWARAIASCVLPIPVYFMELLVGLIQALVFMLLTAVFTLLICQHEEGHERAHQ
ncbi:MAG: ATP synthase F0 subunit A [Verrucomicrobia bacterium]|nr:MAG: ATP synthase F0 subunit A [Verrucomicrobiota bacterium]